VQDSHTTTEQARAALAVHKTFELDKLQEEMESMRAQQAAAEAAMMEAANALDAQMREAAEIREQLGAAAHLKQAHDTQVRDMQHNIRELEHTLYAAHNVALENARRMVEHNQQLGRITSQPKQSDDRSDDYGGAEYPSGGADEWGAPVAIPVKFDIKVETTPGQRVAIVGTWNDWDLNAAFPLLWTAGHVWTTTIPMTPHDTHEYKYVIMDDGSGSDGSHNLHASAQWQDGNNRTLGLGLQLSHAQPHAVVLVEVTDSWEPDPSHQPITLHRADGSVQEVGSTKLLHDCVAELKTEQALLDAGEYVRVLEEISDLTFGTIIGTGSSGDDLAINDYENEWMGGKTSSTSAEARRSQKDSRGAKQHPR